MNSVLILVLLLQKSVHRCFKVGYDLALTVQPPQPSSTNGAYISLFVTFHRTFRNGLKPYHLKVSVSQVSGEF